MENGSTILRLSSNLLLGTIMLFTASCNKEKAAPLKEEFVKGNAGATAAARNGVAGSETFQTVGNGTFYLINRNSGRMLDVPGAATADGTNLNQWAGTGATNQRWTLTARTGGYYSIIGVQSGKGVQVKQSATTDGAAVDIASYTGANNQQWQFVAIGNGYYRIVNRNSSKVLDVSESSIADGVATIQWGSNGGDNQQWALITTNAGGQVGWTFTTTSMPDDVRARITASMNDACARYNAVAKWPARTLTVEYSPGTPTADGSVNGNIRFGENPSYQNTRTVMHEMGHTYGVGKSGGWYNNTPNGPFIGTNAVTTIKTFDGENAVINTGGGHFWPYGLNYDNEWSETGAYRHVKMIFAMRADGM